jgi:hypothetical protein
LTAGTILEPFRKPFQNSVFDLERGKKSSNFDSLIIPSNPDGVPGSD